MRSQTYSVEQWESLEEIKFNHRAKINTKVFCLSGVLREGSFYFGQGTLGSLKKMGPFGRTPKTPTVEKTPLRTHGGLQYYCCEYLTALSRRHSWLNCCFYPPNCFFQKLRNFVMKLRGLQRDRRAAISRNWEKIYKLHGKVFYVMKPLELQC